MRCSLQTTGKAAVGRRFSLVTIFLWGSCRRFVSAFVPSAHHIRVGETLTCAPVRFFSNHGDDWTVSTYTKLMGSESRTIADSVLEPGSKGKSTPLEQRIYSLVGRQFAIDKSAVLAKVLFDEVQVFDPNGPEVIAPDTARKAGANSKTTQRKTKAKSVSISSLKSIMAAEPDPDKRELVDLVLQWRQAKSAAARGGFTASGEKVADRPDWASKIIPDHDGLQEDPDAIPLVLVDGHNIIFHSFYALPQLTAPDGTPIGAVVGFCNVMNKLVLQPWADGSEPWRRVIVAFDSGGENFRHNVYPGYKSGRPEVREELRPQFALIREACEAYGFEVADGPGFEADDVIATLALRAVVSGATNVTVVSQDKDFAQLVTRRVEMLDCYSRERLGPDEVLAKYLAPPGRLADLLAVAGDQSDGIQGAEGYGPVKAAKVLAKHATLEEAVEEICQSLVTRKKEPAVIEETRKEIVLARSIVELRTDVPVKLGLKVGLDATERAREFELGAGQGTGPLFEFLSRLGMKDLARRTLKTLDLREATASDTEHLHHDLPL